MAVMNLVNCGAGSGNLGKPDCSVDFGLIIGAIAIPKNSVYTANDMVDIQTTIQAQLVNDTYADRAFRMGIFKEIDDQSEDIQEKTWGYGDKTVTRGEVYNWVFGYYDGFCLHKLMLGFKDRQNEFDYLFITQDRKVIGTQAVDANGITALGGIAMSQFYVYNWKPATGSEPANYRVKFAVADATQLNEWLGFIEVDFDIFRLNVIQDVILDVVGTTRIVDADGDINISIFAGCGGQNLVTTYGATIANVARFSVTNTLTGAAITLTGVTITGSGSSQYLAFNIDDADTDYPAAGGYINISMVAPSVLNTAGLGYIQSNTLTLEVS